MNRELAKLSIDAGLRISTDSGSVDIEDSDGELNVNFSNWDVVNESRKIIPQKYSSISRLNEINEILFESGVILNIHVNNSRIAQLGKNKKPDIKISKLLGSFFC